MMIHIKLIIMAVLWAGGFVASKFIVQDAGPLMISFLRFLGATCILAILIQPDEDKNKMDKVLLGYVFGAGFIGVFLYNYFFFSGIKMVEASRGSVILSIVPIIVLLISNVLYKEKFSKSKILGIVVSIVGASVVISKGHISRIFTESLGLGELYLFGCVLCAAVFVFLSRQVLKVKKPMTAMFYISAAGTILLAFPAIWEMHRYPVNGGSIKFYLNLLYLSVGPSVIAVTFYYEAITLIGPTRASQYMNLIPVFAVILAMIFLGEELSVSLAVGGGLVSTGLYLTNLS